VLLISPICGEGIPVSRSITHARTHTQHIYAGTHRVSYTETLNFTRTRC